MTDDTPTTNGGGIHPLDRAPGDYPAAVIEEPQDCLDFGTVRWDCRLIDQGAKRHVVGECVVTGRRFEAIWLDYTGDSHSTRDSWLEFDINRVIQFAPKRLDEPGDELHLVGDYQKLRSPYAVVDEDPDRSLNIEEAPTLGPYSSGECPHPGELAKRLEAVVGDDGGE